MGGGAWTNVWATRESDPGPVPDPAENAAVVISLDSVITSMFEVEIPKSVNPANRYLWFLEEGKFVKARILQAAIERGADVILDGTNGGQTVVAEIEKLHAAGYEVVAHYATCSFEEALDRNHSHFLALVAAGQRPWKHNPLSLVLGHRMISAHFEKIAAKTDSVALFDTGTKIKPTPESESFTALCAGIPSDRLLELLDFSNLPEGSAIQVELTREESSVLTYLENDKELVASQLGIYLYSHCEQ
jgi:hypothetical protein